MRRRLVKGRVPLALGVIVLLAAAAWAQASSAQTARGGASATHARAAEHFACSTPTSAHRPCHFSTPSGDVRCVWTPSPNSVTCELLASRRAYRLHPSGHAKTVHVALARRGETLPGNQILTFPEELSCQATKTAMTCNQDEGFGEFKLSPHSSHSA